MSGGRKPDKTPEEGPQQYRWVRYHSNEYIHIQKKYLKIQKDWFNFVLVLLESCNLNRNVRALFMKT
jgi:hypothetical protein